MALWCGGHTDATDPSEERVTPTTKRLVMAAAVLGAAVIVAVIVFARSDGQSAVSDPQQLIERLEAAGIGGCRAEDERAAGCFDAAGVAYFRGELIDEDISVDEAVAHACDESTIVALFTEGQGWVGRVRAHPERAPDLAAALDSTPIACEGPSVPGPEGQT